MTSAEELRKAAALMRERAEEVGILLWRAEGRDVTATQDYRGDTFDPDWDCAFNVAVCRRQDEAEHIASWHPLVASDFAAVLEVAAGELEADYRDGLLVAAAVMKAARTYLGEPASADV